MASVTEDLDNPERPCHAWCTSCGICSKVCPPQCIWIVRGEDPTTGRPVPEPQAFFIDIDICMNCGYCAEFCPFDAIKMDTEFELSTDDRFGGLLFNKFKLAKSNEHYHKIHPTEATEVDGRLAEEKAKAEAKAKAAAEAKAKPAAPAAAATATAPTAAKPA